MVRTFASKTLPLLSVERAHDLIVSVIGLYLTYAANMVFLVSAHGARHSGNLLVLLHLETMGH